jgi:hypothetical protein
MPQALARDAPARTAPRAANAFQLFDSAKYLQSAQRRGVSRRARMSRNIDARSIINTCADCAMRARTFGWANGTSAERAACARRQTRRRAPGAQKKIVVSDPKKKNLTRRRSHSDKNRASPTAN